MGTFRRFLLSALPKFALSRTTGLVTRLPLPRPLRAPAYRLFAKRYGAELGDVDGALCDFRSLAAFFSRPLRDGARVVADAPLVWPCDGRIVTAGRVADGRIPQVKGVDYTVAELLGEEDRSAHATPLTNGSQATIYLAPGDYHRVHTPFEAEWLGCRHIPGALFPVNPGAVASIPRLFVRNERVVFRFRLPDQRHAAVVMVAALNVGDIRYDGACRGPMARGAELGRFGFGSTVVAIVQAGGPEFAPLAPGTAVRQGAAATARAD